MRRVDLDEFVGKIICLDLVNRERPVAKLLEVTDVYAVLKDPYIFVPVQGASGVQVQALSYGAPLFDVKLLQVPLEHVMAVLAVQPQMEQAYIRQTSGIVTETKPSIIVP